MNKILFVTLLCVAAASAAAKTKTSSTGASSKRGFGIGTHDAHPEVVHVGHGGHGGGGDGWGASSHGKGITINDDILVS